MTSTPSPTRTPSAGPSSSNNASGVISEITQVSQPVKSKTPGLITSAQVINSTIWKEVAANAWAYFQPGVGVDNVTGLPRATAGVAGFGAFTDWDLGSYIEAVIDAGQIGLINDSGAWGFDARINKVLTFLETRPLNTTNDWPFWFYNSSDGQGYLINSTDASDSVNIVDTGALLVALNDLISYNASYKQPVDNFVYDANRNGSDYASLVPGLEASSTSNSVYAYYFVSGFASFWPQQLGSIPSQIMTNIFNATTITTYNVTLPDVPLTCEPILLSIFELNNNDTRLMNLMNQVYLAQEACFNITGQYTTFSEGSAESSYIYEWIISPTGTTWTILAGQGVPYEGYPIVYNKIAFSFLALYNSTYARETVEFLEQALPTPTDGYYDGCDVKGNALSLSGGDDNSMILGAALYALQE